MPSGKGDSGSPAKKAARKPSDRTRSAAGGKRYADRQAAKQQAALEARRRRNQRVALGSIALVLVLIATKLGWIHW